MNKKFNLKETAMGYKNNILSAAEEATKEVKDFMASLEPEDIKNEVIEKASTIGETAILAKNAVGESSPIRTTVQKAEQATGAVSAVKEKTATAVSSKKESFDEKMKNFEDMKAKIAKLQSEVISKEAEIISRDVKIKEMEAEIEELKTNLQAEIKKVKELETFKASMPKTFVEKLKWLFAN